MTTSRAPRHGDVARRQQAGRQRMWLVLGGVAVLALAVLVAVVSTGESTTAVSVEDIAGDPTVAGQPLPPPPQDPAQDPQIGERAPVVTGADFDGQPITIGAADAPQLLMFAASWCPACERELPEVVSWLDAGRLPDGVGFTTVITGLNDARPNWPPTDWLEEEGYDGRVLVDDAEGSVAASYGLPATPYWVALDADGRVVFRMAGMIAQEQMDLLARAALGS